MDCATLSDALTYIRTTSGPEARRFELRQKQRMEIELIKARNAESKNTHIDIPDSDHDRDLQPTWFAILDANGIWRNVFDYINEPSDITSAYHVCDMFRDHLQKKFEMMILLPRVFRVLRERKYFRYIDFRTYDHHFQEGFRNGQYANEGILNLRLVSKMCKQAMENAFLAPAEFSKPDWHLHSPIDGTCERYSGGCLRVKFRTTDDVHRMLNTLCPPHSTLARVIDVSDERCGDRESFYTQLESFLELHGESGWVLKLRQLIRREDDFTFDYDNLWRLVSRMPNLKELDLFILRQGEGMRDGEEMRLNRKFQEFPFPTIPSLKRLIVASEGFLHQPTFHEIVKANPDLKAISIQWAHPHDFLFPSTLGNLPNLECFEMVRDEDEEVTLEDIQVLQEVDWPMLKVLIFSPSVVWHTQPRVSAWDFFRFLSHFKKSLVKVVADKWLWNIVDDDDSRSLPVEFPKLQKIEFQ